MDSLDEKVVDVSGEGAEQQLSPTNDKTAQGTETSPAESRPDGTTKGDQDIALPQSSASQINPTDRENSGAWTSSSVLGDSGRQGWTKEVADFWNQFRFNCGMIVNNKHVQLALAIIVFIATNAIMMGIGTFDFIKTNPDLNNIFETVDKTFLILFTIEIAMQFVYHGWRLILDGWLVFDLVIILTSWSFQSVQVIRAFRIFRALRLITRIKTMKNLILALFSVIPRMAAIGLMLMLIFYIFSVMFTQLFKDMYQDGETDYNYFSRMDWTLFTLFQMMTLDNWADIARQVMAVYSWAWLPFIAFVIISGFIVVNLIIAVICDAIAALHKEDKAKLEGVYGGSDTDASSSPMEIREQLDCLEEQMEELTKIQARTFHTLQYLTRQMQKLKQELQLGRKAPPASIPKSTDGQEGPEANASDR